jgi:GNAT superfamily N-acetyltransferase
VTTVDGAAHYRIEPFTPGDAGYRELAALSDRVWPESPASAAWQARDDANRPPDRRPTRWVARHPEEPDAFAGMVDWGPHHWSDDGRNLELRLWVDPGHRRRGLGARLLDEALEAFRSGPALALETSTTEDRPDAATFL